MRTEKSRLGAASRRCTPCAGNTASGDSENGVNVVLRGHYAYYGIAGNIRRLTPVLIDPKRPRNRLYLANLTMPNRRPTSQTSAFFFPDLTIDEIADIVAILFLENSIVGGFNLDIVVRRGRDLLLAGIGFLKRNQLRYRPRLAIILIGRGGAMGRARV
jgi:hypothetical protein